MTRCNLHTHTRFSDGSDFPEMYCEEAIRQGFGVLGFSDHAPVPFENGFALDEKEVGRYVEIILGLKKKYSPGNGDPALDVLLGMEIDFIPGISEPFELYRKAFPFDYLIGSVHLVKNEESGKLWFIDGPDIAIYDEGLKVVFGSDIRRAVTSYYRQIQSMIRRYKPDIIGHVDKIKMYNRDRYFSEKESWYVQLVDETLDLVKTSSCVVEINTRGIYKKRSAELFPGTEILGKLRDRNIPVTLVSDAHKPHELSLGFEETLNLLKILGFEKLCYRDSSGWKENILEK